MSKKRKVVIVCGVAVACVVAGAVLVGCRILHRLDMIDDAPAAGTPVPEVADALEPLARSVGTSGRPDDAAGGGHDWPCWRGPNRDNVSPVRGIRKDWAGGLRKIWEVDYLCRGRSNATWSAPVILGNRLVVTGRDDRSDLVFCLDPETGRLLWRRSYEVEAGTGHGRGARATPAIDGDRVYTFGRSGDLACWRLYDGEPVWRRNVRDDGGEGPKWGYASAPLILGDKLFVQGGGSCRTIAYDKATGAVAWKSSEGTPGYAAPMLMRLSSAKATESQALRSLGEGGRMGLRRAEAATAAQAGAGLQLVAFHGKGVAGLDPEDGRVIWDLPWKTSFGANATTPVASGDILFVTSGYGRGCQAITVGESGAEVLWTNKVFASHHSDPFIIDGYIYGYSGQSYQNKGHFKCAALATGEERWRTGEVGWGTAVMVDGHFVCLDIDGNLFLAKADPDSFVKVTEFRGAMPGVKNPTWTIPVVVRGRIYLRHKRRLICYDLTGRPDSKTEE